MTGPTQATAFPGAAPESAAFAELIENLRALQRQIASTSPPDALAHDIAVQLAKLNQSLAPYGAAEVDRPYGKRWDLPGRGQALVPPLIVHQADDGSHRGHVTFDETHIGAGGVVHGGVIPLLFVELLGLFANAPGKPLSRMAYLRTDFRGPVRVGHQVKVEASLLRVEGRKIVVHGRIFEDGEDLAVSEALFITPR